MAVEVYGHKQANPRRNLALWDLGVIQAKTRSLRERYTSLYNTSETQHASQIIFVTAETFSQCSGDLDTQGRVSQTRVRKLMKS